MNILIMFALAIATAIIIDEVDYQLTKRKLGKRGIALRRR
jgi:hypothetical protein